MSGQLKVFITGGAGYVGAVLVPKLLATGCAVIVYDLFIYGEHVLNGCSTAQNLTMINGDIRDRNLVKESIQGCDAVIHLACISNDPSFELNPKLGRSINLDAFRPLVDIAKDAGVKRFIYASSSSVYGIKAVPNVHESMSLDPLTDYSRFKAECEIILNEYQSSDFTIATVRPATVCGYSPRQRLDVVVNILTNLAYHKREISVFGGDQLRPNINIKDMVEVYIKILNAPKDNIAGEIFNVGYENHTVMQLAEIVREVIGKDVTLKTIPTDDNRSYHISSKKIKDKLGFKPTHSIREAVLGLKKAFENNMLHDPLENVYYYNTKRMQAINLN